MRISGDTIYYVDPQNIPVYFKVLRDTIYVRGNTPIAYKIDRQTEYSFWFHSLSDEIVKLHKSENPEDTLSFSSQKAEAIPTISEVVQKDSVVMYKGTRYRGYVYINPSKMKVIRTTYSDEGIGIDNVYYDNVIHICVYEGKNLLYGQDITKKMFHTVFPEEVLSQMILTDMDFMGVNGKGYHFEATLRIPESSVYFTIISFQELYHFFLLEFRLSSYSQHLYLYFCLPWTSGSFSCLCHHNYVVCIQVLRLTPRVQLSYKSLSPGNSLFA